MVGALWIAYAPAIVEMAKFESPVPLIEGLIVYEFALGPTLAGSLEHERSPRYPGPLI